MTETHPTVSVILPVYNRVRTLPDAMKSVLEQSFRDIELIVIDDASSEDVKGVVDRIGDARVRYIRRETNGGAAAARNTGVERAAGRYIAFQDSDDLWLPGKLNRQLSLLESQSQEVGSVTGAKVLYGRDNQFRYGTGRVACAPAAGRWLTLEEDQLRRALVENRISLQNAIFRRECLPDLPLFDASARANEDWDFTVRLSQRTKIYEDPEPVVFSYITPGSVSQDTRRALMGTIRVLHNNREIYARYPDEHARMLYKIGGLLLDAGRPRAAWRTLTKSIRMRPRNSLRLTGKITKAIINKIAMPIKKCCRALAQ